jgi:hypothetical protein
MSKPSGGRMRENMTVAEEKLTRFAKAAGAGNLLTFTISRWPQAIGTRPARTRLTIFLARHGWRKLFHQKTAGF